MTRSVAPALWEERMTQSSSPSWLVGPRSAPMILAIFSPTAMTDLALRVALLEDSTFTDLLVTSDRYAPRSLAPYWT